MCKEWIRTSNLSIVEVHSAHVQSSQKAPFEQNHGASRGDRGTSNAAFLVTPVAVRPFLTTIFFQKYSNLPRKAGVLPDSRKDGLYMAPLRLGELRKSYPYHEAVQANSGVQLSLVST